MSLAPTPEVEVEAEVQPSTPEAIPAPAEIVAPAEEAPAIVPAPAIEPAPVHAPAHPSAAEAAPADHRVPQSIGEILGRPEKPHWSPQELLKAATTLHGVRGAVIGLHEGLLVAAELPEEVKGDTVAAFLPQMFARMNNYTGEMKLGEVDELLFTMQNAHFQAYKLGDVYLGVLGKSGEALPWEGLRLIADQLVRQTSK
jgi:predicted regulator of Ras-like GTPase activity (Roadblock/LC7/MglB family)